MILHTKNRRRAEFNMSSMTDLVFLLLIFFMLTSTLVAPNALKILLPRHTGQTLAPQNVTVSIDKGQQLYYERQKVDEAQLETALAELSGRQPGATLVLNAEKTVPIERVVTVMGMANRMNLKMILATEPAQ
jgi:biopolymer transport protein ExbD